LDLSFQLKDKVPGPYVLFFTHHGFEEPLTQYLTHLSSVGPTQPPPSTTSNAPASPHLSPRSGNERSNVRWTIGPIEKPFLKSVQKNYRRPA